MKVRALYDFEAEDEEEISFGAGEIIDIVSTDNETQDGWWKGKTKTSREGYFPSTYVEEINEDETEEEEGGVEPESMVLARSVEEAEFKRITLVMEGMRDVRAENSEKLTQVIKEKMNQQIEEWKSQEEEDWIKQNAKVTQTPHVAQLPQPPKEETSPSNYDFRAKMPEKWSTEDVGNWLIHMNFAEFAPLFKEHEISGEALLELDHDTFKEMGVKSIGRRIKMLNAISIVLEKEPELQDELQGLPSAFSSDSLRQLSDSSDDDSRAPKANGENQVLAIADFFTDKKEELRFTKGDVIIIVDKSSPEWWRGELKGKTGLFPRSHVTDISEDGGSSSPNHRMSLISSVSQSVVLSGIDAVSPQGVQSAKNRKVSQKEITISQKQSRNARAKIVAAPVPEIQAQEISRPDYQGWLTKQGGSVKNWKRRWFVLKDYCLYYFKDPVDGNALGCLTLPSYTIAPTKEVSKKFAFKAFHAGARIYYFVADSESEMLLWIKALTKAAMGDVVAPVAANSSRPAFAGPDSSSRPVSTLPVNPGEADAGNSSRSPRKPAPVAPAKTSPAVAPVPAREDSSTSLSPPQPQQPAPALMSQPPVVAPAPQPAAEVSQPAPAPAPATSTAVPPATSTAAPPPIPSKPNLGATINGAPSSSTPAQPVSGGLNLTTSLPPAGSVNFAALAAAAAAKKQAPPILPKPKLGDKS